jgi:hypothetical protein
LNTVLNSDGTTAISDHPRVGSDYVFHELTRSICPVCRRVIDAKILLRDNQVFMSKRCPQCGPFMALVYADAKAYVSYSQYNKPGTIPLAYEAKTEHGCPHDCGLCHDHEQHACLGIIEVNSACGMDCPLCFADAGQGFSLTLERPPARAPCRGPEASRRSVTARRRKVVVIFHAAFSPATRLPETLDSPPRRQR